MILGSHDEHLGLLSAMEERKLLSSGDYFVVGVNLDAYGQYEPTHYMKGVLRENVDPFILDAYNSYLGIVPSSPIAFNDFSVKVNEYMSKPPFNFPSFTGVTKVVRYILIKFPKMLPGWTRNEMCHGCVNFILLSSFNQIFLLKNLDSAC